MHLSMLLDMACEGFGDRVAFGSRVGADLPGLTYSALDGQAKAAAAWIAERRVERVGLVDVNSDAVPVLLFGAGLAGVPFVPLNYRLAGPQLEAILRRISPAVVVVEEPVLARLGTIEGVQLVSRSQFLAELPQSGAPEHPAPGDADDIAVLLFTSGTTAEPKAAVLRHKHLTSYVIGTVEFMGAEDDEAALVSVPPYHIAGISAVLSSVYAGRRIVYQSAFSADEWVRLARDEAVTQAMVVPTMLGRILDVLTESGERLEQLRHLSYGGGRMPLPVLELALGMLPHVDFVNAYGLTETSSTIAVLGPEDHRLAVASDAPELRRRLSSVGRPLPTVDVEVRDDLGDLRKPGELGEVWVRGDQVAGEYLGSANRTNDGWFPTKDSGYLDEDGFLYLAGRLDDVIVRGGENLSPGEIEDVLLAHPSVADAAVVGLPDTGWGEQVVAAVVLSPDSRSTEAELQDWVRSRLRSSKTPDRIIFRSDLPYNEMGKLVRRLLKAQLLR